MEAGIEPSRIGVFVCHCGNNIGGVVDVPAVVEYAKTLPDIVYAEENLYMCSSEGLNLLKKSINRENLNRVVVASCTPRTHEPVFRTACEEAGLNKYLFEMANIREQCSWVHMHYPAEATEKAKDIVRMAAAKAHVLEPQIEPELDVKPSSLVIGGGIAGMTAATSLASQGFKVHIVEKEAELGGMLRRLYELYPGERDASEILGQAVRAVRLNRNIDTHTSTVVKDVKGFIGNFEVTLQKEDSDELEQLKVGTIIVATGAANFEPVRMYGYKENENVITQLELEQLLKAGELRKPEKVVMIQCVGAREETGRTYCSRICCMVAIKNAMLIKDLYPDAQVYLFFRDLQTYGKEYEDYYRRAREKLIEFVKYLPEDPPKVTSKPNGKLVVKVTDVYLGAEIEIDCDLVVLSTPSVQHEEGRKLSSILKVPLGPDGFFSEAHPKLKPVDFPTDGIYVCGTAHGPKDITESIAQAYAAASRAGIPMEAGKVRAEAVKAFVDEDLCVGCGACAASCTFNAIELSSFGQPRVIEANCKGCGVCAAECPMGAMQLRHFKDNQLVSVVESLLTPEKRISLARKFKPIIVCFACRWCSYAAADLAGITRLQYPVNVRIILVPCSGRVDVLHILTAFMRGVDGVIVTGCLKDDCHYIDGNIRAEDRVRVMKKALNAIGINEGRLKIEFVSASEAERFATIMKNMTEKIRKLGPNPLTVVGQGKV